MAKKRFELLETAPAVPAPEAPKRRGIARFLRKLEMPGEKRLEPPPLPEPAKAEAPKPDREESTVTYTVTDEVQLHPPRPRPASRPMSEAEADRQVDEVLRQIRHDNAVEQARSRRNSAIVRLVLGAFIFFPLLTAGLVNGGWRPMLAMVLIGIILAVTRRRGWP